MAISRRQFFRGLTGHGETGQRQSRSAAVETYVRTNLLPYDFALTGEQTEEVLKAAVAGIDIDSEGELLTPDRRSRLQQIVDERVQQWREEYLKAEEARRDAIPFVVEFLTLEASPEVLQRLRDRFHTPYSAAFEEEIERQIRVWMSGLPNSRLAGSSVDALRELVFSEIRSWC